MFTFCRYGYLRSDVMGSPDYSCQIRIHANGMFCWLINLFASFTATGGEKKITKKKNPQQIVDLSTPFLAFSQTFEFISIENSVWLTLQWIKKVIQDRAGTSVSVLYIVAGRKCTLRVCVLVYL